MKIFGPHKRRTRQHVIADLGTHHVEGFILEEGHTVERFHHDYGYDRFMVTYDEDGNIEPGIIRLQVKSTEEAQHSGANVIFDLDVRDLNLWLAEITPVVLIVFDVSARRARWIDVRRYFDEDPSRIPGTGAKTIRVRIPARQLWSRKAVRTLRERKQRVVRVVWEE